MIYIFVHSQPKTVNIYFITLYISRIVLILATAFASHNTWSQSINSYKKTSSKLHKFGEKKCSAPNTRNACSSTAVQPPAVFLPLQNRLHRRIVSFHAGLYLRHSRILLISNFRPESFQRQQQLGDELLDPHEIQREFITVQQEAARMWGVSSRQPRLLVSSEKWASRHGDWGH